MPIRIKINKWFPIIFLLITWYIPRQTAPGGYLENYVFLRWITFVIIPISFVFFLLYRWVFKLKIHLPNIVLPSIIIFLIILSSAMINRSSTTATLFTFLIYLRYPLLFIILSNMNLDEKALKLFLKVFLFLTIIQIPETFYRYFILGIRGDLISWTLGPWGTFDLGVYMLYATALLVSKSLILKEVRFRYFILIFCFFLVALFGEIKAFIFSAPVIIGIVIFSSLGLNFFIKLSIKKLTIFALIIVIALIGFAIGIKYYNEVFPESKSLEDIKTGLNPEEGGRIARISAFVDVLEQANFTSIQYLLGWGPGSSLGGNYYVETGKLLEFILAQYKNQLAESLVDIGFWGITAYYWLILSLLLIFIKHHRIEKGKLFIFLNRALMGIWFYYSLIGPIYDIVWRHDSPQYTFFFLSAVLYNRYNQIKNKL